MTTISMEPLIRSSLLLRKLFEQIVDKYPERQIDQLDVALDTNGYALVTTVRASIAYEAILWCRKNEGKPIYLIHVDDLHPFIVDYYMAGEEEECAKRLLEILQDTSELP